jgi:predicted metal-dependent HD superfamily phosphohydrolase
MHAPNPALDHRHPALAPLLAAGFAPGRLEQVLAFYDEPHRAYHDRQHLLEMFDASIALGERLSATQCLALLFHDAIYVPGAARGSNEVMSAQLLRVYTSGLDRVTVDTACALVIDTAEHVARSPDAELVLDLDLMRLAAPPPEFDRYSSQVFAEQRSLIAIADDAAALAFFSARRLPFFQHLLDRTWIYCTAAGRRHFEVAARANLKRAIGQVAAAERRQGNG